MSDAQFERKAQRLLEAYTPAVEPRAGWDDVLSRAGVTRRRRPPRVLAIALLSAVVLTLTLATPLRGALVRSFADFSAWLTGTPGTPATAEEQQAFEEANRRSWAGFPHSPELRRLAQVESDGSRYDLFGFRSGESLCLRVVAAGEASGSTLACAPVDELRLDDGPVRVVLADWGVGGGDKTQTVGFDTYHSSRAQITAGIAADGVDEVELTDDQGSHRVEVDSNAFLYVADRPEVGQRVTEIRARLAGGRVVEVPFAVAPWGISPSFTGSTAQPGGPTEVERTVSGGEIGWLRRREERGEPLGDDVGRRLRPLRGERFGRLIAPDPDSPIRVAVTIGEVPAPPPRFDQSQAICYTVISTAAAAGGCTRLDDPLQGPFTFGWSVAGAGEQFATFAGLASDDVARLELFTARGDRIPVALRDNVYLAEIALARFPVKLVAYDREGRVIGIEETPIEERPGRVVGEPVVELQAAVPGVGTMQLRAYRTSSGGGCWFVRGTGQARLNGGGCTPADWTRAPIRLGTAPNPAAFVYGRVRADVASLTLRFDDGTERELRPAADGYVLVALPAVAWPRRLTEIVGHDRQGTVVERVPLGPPPRP